MSHQGPPIAKIFEWAVRIKDQIIWDVKCIYHNKATITIIIYFFNLLLLQYWDLNSGSQACYTGALQQKLHLQPLFFALVIFYIGSLVFAWASDPPTYASQVSWDYRHEPPCPALITISFNRKKE
jgi:hypothetical protein